MLPEGKVSHVKNYCCSRLIAIPCRQEVALAVIQEIKNIEKTEVKAEAVEVYQQTESIGTYQVRGRFAGIPWHNEFAYVLHEQGFHSLEAHPPNSGPRIQGGFVAIRTGAQTCTILHYEQYVLPKWAVPVKPLIEWYLQWSMKKELLDLKTIILAQTTTI